MASTTTEYLIIANSRDGSLLYVSDIAPEGGAELDLRNDGLFRDFDNLSVYMKRLYRTMYGSIAPNPDFEFEDETSNEEINISDIVPFKHTCPVGALGTQFGQMIYQPW